MGVAVEYADEEEHDGVPDHGVAVAQAVGEPSNDRAAKDIDRGAEAEEQGDLRGVEAVVFDEDEGGEGQEYLLARAVEKLEAVVKIEFTVEIKARATEIACLAVLTQSAQKAGKDQQEHHQPYHII